MSTIGQLLIGKSVAYAAKVGGGTIANMADVINLVDGAVAFFGEDGNLITAAANFADQKIFYIFVGGVDSSKLRKSKPIVRHEAIFNASAYSAPVKEVRYVGDDGTNAYDVNLPSTLVVDTFAYLNITGTNNGNTGMNKSRRYEYKVKTGDTKANVVNGLVSIINADTDKFVTAAAIDAASVNAGISLTSNDYDFTFVMSVGGILSNATISKQTNTVYCDYGIGRGLQVAAMEDELIINEGNGNYTFMNDSFFSYTKQADTSATYKTYNINWDYTAKYPASSQMAVPQYLTLCVVTGASQITNLDTLFAAAFGNVANAESETGASETNEAVIS